jgi:hypothetical protein
MGNRVLLAADGFWRPSNQRMGVLNTDPPKQLGATELGARGLPAEARAGLEAPPPCAAD